MLIGKKLQAALDLICEEIERSEKIHPNYPADLFERLAIIIEESGEIAKAVNDFSMIKDSINYDNILRELIQTAAMCLKMYVNMDCEPKRFWFKCKNCGNKALKTFRPVLCFCDDPEWLLMIYQESYISGKSSYTHPEGEI